MLVPDTEKSSGGESGHPLAKPKPQEEPSSGSGSMGSMTGTQAVPGQGDSGLDGRGARQQEDGPLQ